MKRLLLLSAAIAATLVVTSQGVQSAPISYIAFLDGPSESPPNASPGTGFSELDIDLVAHTMRVQVTFSDLLGTTTASHIHSPTPSPGTLTAGIATQTPTFSGFPLGVTSGSYDMTFDLTMTSSFNAAFVTANGGTAAGAETALAAGLMGGLAYLNIHTSLVPGGEIRGFYLPVPEPSAFVMLGLGGLALGAVRLVRRQRA